MKAGGYGMIVEPGVPDREFDTVTCCHCGNLVKIKASDPNMKVDIGGFCRLCMKATCGPCADRGTCVPFEKKLEAMERQDRLRRELEQG